VPLPRKESWEDHNNKSVRNARPKKLLRKKYEQQKQEKEL
jgi:hypothetical protein